MFAFSECWYLDKGKKRINVGLRLRLILKSSDLLSLPFYFQRKIHSLQILKLKEILKILFYIFHFINE